FTYRPLPQGGHGATPAEVSRGGIVRSYCVQVDGARSDPRTGRMARMTRRQWWTAANHPILRRRERRKGYADVRASGLAPQAPGRHQADAAGNGSADNPRRPRAFGNGFPEDDP